MRRPPLVLASVVVAAVVALAAVSCGDSNEPSEDAVTSVGSSTTAAADDASTTSVEPSTSTEASDDTTSSTTAQVEDPPASSGVIVAGAGVLGWAEGGAWHPIADGDLPAVAGDAYTRIRLGEPTTVVVGGEVVPGCEFVEDALDIEGLMDFGDWPDYPVASSAPWNLQPHPVELLPTDNPVYQEVVAGVLAGQGVDDPTPALRQVIRTDLEGDGVDEILITAGHDRDFATVEPGSYSIALLRKVIEGEVQTAILGFDQVPVDDPSIFLLVYRVAAVADLNGDGRSDIAIDDQYYEGGGTRVLDYVDDDLGPVVVLDVGCGV